MVWEGRPNPERRHRILRWLECVETQDILAAIHRYRELGVDGVRRVYHFHEARGYAIVHHRTRYPCRALLGIAHEIAHGVRLTPRDCGPLEDFGERVQRRFRELGFTVEDI